jgi:hypothetical protein
MPQSRAPLIIAIALLLLPVLYVGSYLALVVPEGVGLVQMQTAPDKILGGRHTGTLPNWQSILRSHLLAD